MASGANIVPNYSSGIVTGPAFMIKDPALGPLGDNGGRSWTMPPLAGSPAIDAALGSLLATDQTGLPRPFGARADLGAYESYADPVPANAQTGVAFGPLTLSWGPLPPGGWAEICFAGPGYQ